MRSEEAVAVCMVTFNAAPDLPRCFSAIEALDHHPLEIVLVDCKSSDETLQVAEEEAPRSIPCKLIPLHENLGFAGGMNLALASTRAPFVLCLNADAWPEPSYVSRLLARARHPELKVGAVTGRLIRPRAPCEPPRLDACGMRLAPAWRHLDRGSGQTDRGQWLHPARVFGATGAASLFRRQALEDVAVDGQIFDPRFHSFREDAELCFRLRERGWEIIYEPGARAVHRRFNLPSRRRSMPALVNYHSLKNRYLLRLYHQTLSNLVWTLPLTLPRDLAILVYVGVAERGSLAAYRWLWHHRKQIWQRRRKIQSRRSVAAKAIDRWFLREEYPL